MHITERNNIQSTHLTAKMNIFLRGMLKLDNDSEVDERMINFSPLVLDCIVGNKRTFFFGWAHESLLYYKKLVIFITHHSNQTLSWTGFVSRLWHCLNIIDSGVANMPKGTFPIQVFNGGWHPSHNPPRFHPQHQHHIRLTRLTRLDSTRLTSLLVPSSTRQTPPPSALNHSTAKPP